MMLAEVTEACVSCSHAAPGIDPTLAFLLGFFGFVGIFGGLAGAAASAAAGGAGAASVGAAGSAPGGGVAGETGGRSDPEFPSDEADHTRHSPAGPDPDAASDAGPPPVSTGPPTLENGAIVTHYSDGSTTYERNEGTITVYPNGTSSVSIDPKGGVTETAGDDTTRYEGPEGSSVLRPDGGTESRRPLPDVDAYGNPIEGRPGDLLERSEPDGTKVVAHPDGTTEVSRPDGSSTTTGPTGTTHVNPDTTIDVERRDGTRERIDPRVNSTEEWHVPEGVGGTVPINESSDSAAAGTADRTPSTQVSPRERSSADTVRKDDPEP